MRILNNGIPVNGLVIIKPKYAFLHFFHDMSCRPTRLKYRNLVSIKTNVYLVFLVTAIRIIYKIDFYETITPEIITKCYA